MVVAFGLSPPAIGAAGATCCPKAGGATAAANMVNESNCRRTFTFPSRFLDRLCAFGAADISPIAGSGHDQWCGSFLSIWHKI